MRNYTAERILVACGVTEPVQWEYVAHLGRARGVE